MPLHEYTSNVHLNESFYREQRRVTCLCIEEGRPMPPEHSEKPALPMFSAPGFLRITLIRVSPGPLFCYIKYNDCCLHIASKPTLLWEENSATSSTSGATFYRECQCYQAEKIHRAVASSIGPAHIDPNVVWVNRRDYAWRDLTGVNEGATAVDAPTVAAFVALNVFVTVAVVHVDPNEDVELPDDECSCLGRE